MEFNIQTWKQSSYIVYNSLLLNMCHITSFEELRDSGVSWANVFRPKITSCDFRLPASRFPLSDFGNPLNK